MASYKNQADILEYDLKVMEIMNKLTRVKDKSEMIISSIIKIFNREKLKILEHLEASEEKKLEILRYSYFLRSATKNEVLKTNKKLEQIYMLKRQMLEFNDKEICNSNYESSILPIFDFDMDYLIKKIETNIDYLNIQKLQSKKIEDESDYFSNEMSLKLYARKSYGYRFCLG